MHRAARRRLGALVVLVATACGGSAPPAGAPAPTQLPSSPSVSPSSNTPSHLPPTRSSPSPRFTGSPRPSPTRPKSSTQPSVKPTHSVKPPSSPTATSVPTIGGADNRVYVLGDSVLLGTVQTLPAALRGWRVTMNCVGSLRLPQGIQILRAVRSRIGAVVVIQMGNNYIPGEDGTFASQIDQAMRVLAGVRRVVWVTVAEKWSSRITINRAIRAATGRWPTMRVADWAPIIATHPAYAYDMLHLSPAGRLAMARLIAGVVGSPPR